MLCGKSVDKYFRYYLNEEAVVLISSMKGQGGHHAMQEHVEDYWE